MQPLILNVAENKNLICLQAALTFIYLVFCECSLKVRHKEDPLIQEPLENDCDEAVFNQPEDDTENQQNVSVSIQVPASKPRRCRTSCGSLPSNATSSLNSSFHYSLPHSFFNENG